MDLIGAFRVFLRVAEAGGFSAAARDLGVGQPAVSKQMAALERQLATRLFNRSSHAFSLSDDGLALLEHARIAVEAVDETQDLARLRRQQLGGSLRMAAPVVFGRTRLVACLCELVRLHPQLQIDLVLDDRFVDLAEERIDLAVRVGVITDTNLVCRELPPVRRVALASPEYLARRGVPRHPDELPMHEAIANAEEAKVAFLPGEFALLSQSGHESVARSLKEKLSLGIWNRINELAEAYPKEMKALDY